MVRLPLATEWVNPNATTGENDTPLTLTARNGRRAIVQLLLAMEGVDSKAKTFDGHAAFLWAVENRSYGGG